MTVTLRLPTVLETLAGGATEHTVEADTVGEMLNQIGARFPRLRDRLMTPEGALRPFVNVFVGVDSIKDRDGLATRVRDGDVVQIMAAVAGG